MLAKHIINGMSYPYTVPTVSTENMKKIVQKKLDADEELTSVEKEWLEKYSKKHPDLAPKKAEPVVEEAPAPEEPPKPTTEELLTEIVTILKTK